MQEGPCGENQTVPSPPCWQVLCKGLEFYIAETFWELGSCREENVQSARNLLTLLPPPLSTWIQEPLLWREDLKKIGHPKQNHSPAIICLLSNLVIVMIRKIFHWNSSNTFICKEIAIVNCYLCWTNNKIITGPIEQFTPHIH